jgi:hypothetical protein
MGNRSPKRVGEMLPIVGAHNIYERVIATIALGGIVGYLCRGGFPQLNVILLVAAVISVTSGIISLWSP